MAHQKYECLILKNLKVSSAKVVSCIYVLEILINLS